MPATLRHLVLVAAHMRLCAHGLCYPVFNKPIIFHLDTDASDHQLEAVIMQDKNPIAFYRESSIQLKRSIQPLRENKSYYQLLKPAKNTRIY
jgi:hypothetical protein